MIEQGLADSAFLGSRRDQLGYSVLVELTFESGTTERHQVRFTFSKFWGGLSISVDGVDVVRQVQMFSLDLVKSYEFVVGDQEQHVVKIEKHRKRFLGGFWPQPVLAYVDGRLVAEGVA